MKTFKCLFLIMFSVMLMSVSCEKEPNTIVDGNTVISLNDLNGEWVFSKVKIVCGGVWQKTGIIDNCRDLIYFECVEYHDPMLFNFKFNNGTCEMTDICTDIVYNFEMKLEENVLTIGNEDYVFKVVAYDKTIKELSISPINKTITNYIVKQ